MGMDEPHFWRERREESPLHGAEKAFHSPTAWHSPLCQWGCSWVRLCGQPKASVSSPHCGVDAGCLRGSGNLDRDFVSETAPKKGPAASY